VLEDRIMVVRASKRSVTACWFKAASYFWTGNHLVHAGEGAQGGRLFVCLVGDSWWMTEKLDALVVDVGGHHFEVG
jgi:hypothetical protein